MEETFYRAPMAPAVENAAFWQDNLPPAGTSQCVTDVAYVREF